MSVIDVLAASPMLFIASVVVLGLIVGSFLNVVIYRVPVMMEMQWREQCEELETQKTPHPCPSPTRGEGSGKEVTFNLVTPRSACPSCKTLIKAWQNIPLVSYLFLKGRCANCNARISARYPLVEMLTAILSAAVAWKFGFGWPAVAALVLTWFLIALTFIDIDHQLLPDSMTLPLLWLGLAVQLAGIGPISVDLRSSVIGAIAGYLSLWSVYHLFRLATGKEGMGYGDFKLLAALGAWLGWKMLLPIILVSAAVGAVVGIVMLTVRRQSRATPIPFGPFLAAAGWLMLLFGPQVVERYLGLFSHAQ